MSCTLSVPVCPFPDHKSHGCSPEAKRIADPVLQITLIRKMHQLFIIDKQDKSRRGHSRLGAVIDPQRLPLVGGGLLEHAGLIDDLIEDTGLDPEVLIVMHHLDHSIELDQTLSCLGGDKDQLRVGQEGKDSADVFRKLLHGMVVLFNKIPFIYSDNDRFASLMGDAGDLGILFGHSL